MHGFSSRGISLSFSRLPPLLFLELKKMKVSTTSIASSVNTMWHMLINTICFQLLIICNKAIHIYSVDGYVAVCQTQGIFMPWSGLERSVMQSSSRKDHSCFCIHDILKYKAWIPDLWRVGCLRTWPQHGFNLDTRCLGVWSYKWWLRQLSRPIIDNVIAFDTAQLPDKLTLPIGFACDYKTIPRYHKLYLLRYFT